MSRLIGIVGTTYCGSTVLSRMLAAYPAVASAGEVQHILKPGGRAKYSPCSVCYDQCPVFTRAMIDRCTEATLYHKVAAAFDKPILVVSDKSPASYRRFAEPKTMEGIVLYRRPEGYATSARRYEGANPLQAARTWARLYAQALAWCETFLNRHVVVSLEWLAEDHVPRMRQIAKEMDLGPGEVPVDPSTLVYHHVHGNTAAHKREGVFVDRRWKDELSESEIAEISDDESIATVLRMLDRVALS